MRKTTLFIILLVLIWSYSCLCKHQRFLQSESEDTGEVPVEDNENNETIDLHYEFGSSGFFMCILISIFLTLFAGLMSGLTVGLLSIDTLELEMKMIHGTEEQKKLAADVLPLLKKHHYLLVTLLLS